MSNALKSLEINVENADLTEKDKTDKTINSQVPLELDLIWLSKKKEEKKKLQWGKVPLR